MKEIRNHDLTPADVPPRDADWDVIGEFALTFNEYEHLGTFEKCAEIANARRHGSLSDLRACLFFEQRGWRHSGYGPNEEGMAYIRSLVEKIRSKVLAGDRADS